LLNEKDSPNGHWKSQETKNKTYSVTIKSIEQKDQEVIQNSEEFKGMRNHAIKLKRKIVNSQARL